MGQDKVIKALAFHQMIRIYVVRATDAVAEVKRRTGATPEVSIALGRLAIGSLLVGALESTDAKIYVRVNGGGPVGSMNADSDAFGNVRAYAANPTAQTSAESTADAAFDIPGVVGNNGFLYIIKDLGLKEYFTSQTQLVSGDLSMDFAQYFAESQQTPTAMSLDVLATDEGVQMAAGFVAQVLPDTPEDVMQALQENMKKIPSITAFLADHTLEELLAVLAGEDVEVLQTLPVQFHCTCSKAKFLDAFATLPRAELEAMVADAHDEEVICQYCGEKYYITNEELREILAKTKE